MSAKQQIGRLAMRHEGAYWNAYYAMPGTMKDALLLGSIRMAIVENKGRKQAFMDIMREAVSDIIEAAVGERPVWPTGPQPARRERTEWARMSESDDDEACPNCGGLGIVAGCFEDTCSGADCDPEDAEYCCAPARCGWCRPKLEP